jgi:hypothetical protein
VPYVITTHPGQSSDYETRGEHIAAVGLSRVAVATLEEAREMVFRVIDEQERIDDLLSTYADAIFLADGGTVGPLPDGTIIEVERVGWIDFEMMARRGDTALPPIEVFDRDDYRADLLAAFNAS